MSRIFSTGFMKKAEGRLALLLAALVVAGSLSEPASAALAQETAELAAADRAQTCTLTLDAGENGWFDGSLFPDGKRARTVEVDVPRGEACTGLMTLLPVPETDGDLRFAGWSLKEEVKKPEEWLTIPEEGIDGTVPGGSGGDDGSVEITGVVEKDLVLYAVWEEVFEGSESDEAESGGEDPVGEDSAGEESIKEDPAGEKPAGAESAGEDPAGAEPVGENPVEEEQVPPEEGPVEDSAGKAAAEQEPAGEAEKEAVADLNPAGEEAAEGTSADGGIVSAETQAEADAVSTDGEVLSADASAEQVTADSMAASGRRDEGEEEEDDSERRRRRRSGDGEEKEPELCTITFDANGGHYGRHHETTFQEVFEKGERIDLDDYRPRRYGSAGFLGWSLTPGGALLPSEDYIVQESVTLYACWKKELWDAEITLAKTSVVYTGKAQTPAVTVVYEGRKLQKDTDYTVRYDSNQNAGTATVKVKGKGAYTGTVKLTFQITKAAQKLTVKSAAARVAAGKKTAVKVFGAKGSPKYTYKSSNTGVAAVSSSGKVTARKVGTVRITVTAAATKNYTSASASVTIKVVPAATKKLTAKNEKKGIRLTWKQVAGATGYFIYRDGKKIATISKGATVTYLDKKATVKNKKYTYKVVAAGSTGTSTIGRTVKVRRKVPKSSGKGTSSSSSGSSGETGSGTSSGTSSGSSASTGSGSGGSSSSASPLVQTGLRYCFESGYVSRTLTSSAKGDLAVIDTDGISQTVIRAAVNRGVKVYGYLNTGALEQERSYYNTYKSLRIAGYDGWAGEYWVDVTDRAWTDHLIAEAKKMKAAGATGVYLDNTDILYMVQSGFAEENTKMLKAAPSAAAVYEALCNVVKTIQNTVGITVMPNGGDVFVRQFVQAYPGVLREVNQEGVLYNNNKAQPTSERRYYTEYLDWCRNRGLLVRGIEYINTQAGAQKCLEYYREHGWQGLYVSRHTNLEGD